MEPNYLAGVIEGFYGKPWTQEQRVSLLPRLVDWGLNTYFYCPKDDLKHRAIWRESYAEKELRQLAELIDGCGHHGVRFIYGLSPGLDIRFSDEDERTIIRQRLSQLIGVGARHFALLFDDLPGSMSDADQQAFGSVAEAQCAVTNEIFDWLREQFSESRLLFCPTPYCDRMDRSNLGGDDYLDRIGTHLKPGIDCLWTGPEIISQEISAESIRQLSDRIGRAPVIWDNLHANDYDLRRLFCGPYSGRPAETLRLVAGVMANANNEFGINYVPFRTMGECLSDPDSYQPRAAFERAVAAWMEDYQPTRTALQTEDLQLLADCYYLPFEEGAEATKMFALIERLLRSSSDSWGGDYDKFLAYEQRVEAIFEALTEIHDRELFYAWSRRVWELREEMGLIKDVLGRIKSGEDVAAGLELEHHLPHTCRGGITARLQRLIEMDENGRFSPA